VLPAKQWMGRSIDGWWWGCHCLLGCWMFGLLFFGWFLLALFACVIVVFSKQELYCTSKCIYVKVMLQLGLFWTKTMRVSVGKVIVFVVAMRLC